MIAFLLGMVSCASAPPAAPAPACADPAAAAFLRDAPVDADPVTWAVAHLRENDALVLGEFHGLAPQIRFTGEVLVAAAKAGLDVDLGAELLSASRQPELDALVWERKWDPAGWSLVVAGRPLLGPLAIADYASNAQAARQALALRPGAGRVVGLSPDCGFGTVGDATGAIGCLDGREAALAERAEAMVLAKGRKLLLSVGFNHAARVLSPDNETPQPTATARLSARHKVFTVLLAGPMAEGAEGWGRTCDGLLDALGAARGGRPYAADLGSAPWNRLAAGCLGDPKATGSLVEAFDGVVWLGDPAGFSPPTALTLADIEAVGPEAIGQWNRFQVELQGLPVGNLNQDARMWAATAQQEAARLAGLKLRPVGVCAGSAGVFVGGEGGGLPGR